jgi:hypothetical protein
MDCHRLHGMEQRGGVNRLPPPAPSHPITLGHFFMPRDAACGRYSHKVYMAFATRNLVRSSFCVCLAFLRDSTDTLLVTFYSRHMGALLLAFLEDEMGMEWNGMYRCRIGSL